MHTRMYRGEHSHSHRGPPRRFIARRPTPSSSGYPRRTRHPYTWRSMSQDGGMWWIRKETGPIALPRARILLESFAHG